jgi:hypothetical protein
MRMTMTISNTRVRALLDELNRLRACNNRLLKRKDALVAENAELKRQLALRDDPLLILLDDSEWDKRTDWTGEGHA